MATKVDEAGSDTVKTKRRNGSSGDGTREPGIDEEPVAGDLDELAAAIKPGEILEQVTTFARHNPHLALAGAAAVGFVLGGGLSPRLVGAIGMLAARRYLQGSMKETLESVLKGV